MPLSTNTPHNSPGGFGNASPGSTMSMAAVLDPGFALVDHDDFNAVVAASYTNTAVGAGTFAAGVGAFGVAVSTTTSGAADAVHVSRPQKAFLLAAPKRTFYKFAGQLSDITNDVFYCGLLNGATLAASTDGIYLNKATGTGALTLNSLVGGVLTSTPLPAADVLVAATAFELGLTVTRKGDVEVYFNPVTGNNTPNAAVQGRGAAARLLAPGLTAVLLGPIFGLVNTSAVARTLTVDFQTAVQER